MADVAYHLYRHVMRYNPENLRWFNRDRFYLNKRIDIKHLQYIFKLLLKTCIEYDNYPDNYYESILRQSNHSVRHLLKNVVTTGPLGQGVANAVGVAPAKFNKPDAVLVDHRTYCIMGDGEMPWKAYPTKLHTGSSRSYTMTTTTQSMETPISPSPKTSLQALKLWVGTRSRWTAYIRTSNHSETQYDVLIMRLADQHSSRHG
ncbi:unnamed protein product, partial [Musa acuminata subsp. malaccensis]